MEFDGFIYNCFKQIKGNYISSIVTLSDVMYYHGIK